jgi:hypothetical protein
MQTFDEPTSGTTPKVAWNKGTALGSKPPLQTKQVWAIRTKLQVEHRLRDSQCLIWRSTASCEVVIS